MKQIHNKTDIKNAIKARTDILPKSVDIVLNIILENNLKVFVYKDIEVNTTDFYSNEWILIIDLTKQSARTYFTILEHFSDSYHIMDEDNLCVGFYNDVDMLKISKFNKHPV